MKYGAFSPITCVRSLPNPSHFMVGNGLPSYVQDNSVVVPVRPEPLFTLICLGAATCENKNIYMKIYSIPTFTYIQIPRNGAYNNSRPKTLIVYKLSIK